MGLVTRCARRLSGLDRVCLGTSIGASGVFELTGRSLGLVVVTRGGECLSFRKAVDLFPKRAGGSVHASR